MIQHHNGALIMVKDLFDTAGAGQDAELFNFTTDIDSGQRAEIRIMQTMLASAEDRKSTRLNSSHSQISYAVFCLKKKKKLSQLRNEVQIARHSLHLDRHFHAALTANVTMQY